MQSDELKDDLSDVQAESNLTIPRVPETLKLSPEDSIKFVETLLDPPEPNEHLKAASRNYREMFRP